MPVSPTNLYEIQVTPPELECTYALHSSQTLPVIYRFGRLRRFTRFLAQGSSRESELSRQNDKEVFFFHLCSLEEERFIELVRFGWHPLPFRACDVSLPRPKL